MEQVHEQPTAGAAISSNGFLVVVAVFPVLFALALTVIIKTFVPFSTIDADTRFGAIITPEHNRAISRNYVVTGITKQDFPKKHLFLVEENNGVVYPKTPVSKHAGPWSVNLYTGAPVDNRFRILLLAVTPDDRDRFNGWLKTGELTGQYPGLPLTESMQELTAVTVRVSE